ncbi:MAG: preprotein translocase subunit SecG [Bacteroidales bacterium]|nr:preprotein translocase subunit SecG [Bacteroidales bacterium]
MNVLFTILTVLVLIASGLLTIIVLLQNGKGGGLASNFVAGNQTFGVRQTTDILEKITWGLVAFVGIGAIIINIFTLNPVKEGVDFTEQITTEVETPDFSTTMPEAVAPAAEVPAEEAQAAQAE